MSAAEDDIASAALDPVLSVSRETLSRLKAFVALLAKWQKAENLVSTSTLADVWRRHVADSAQLVGLFPDTRRWIDLGSGAGFPGMVVAIAGRDTQVHLVESNRRKCAFLRQAVREAQAPAVVHEGRIAEILWAWDRPVERVMARALAPLVDLLGLAAPLMLAGVPAAFHKGLDFRREMADARHAWSFDLVEHQSRIGDGVILEISGLRSKTKASHSVG